MRSPIEKLSPFWRLPATLAVIRLAAGLLGVLFGLLWKESGMLVMMDFPTLGAYWLAGTVLKLPVSISDTTDPLFLVAGIATWTVCGIAFSSLVSLINLILGEEKGQK